jgi:hypothetical protein
LGQQFGHTRVGVPPHVRPHDAPPDPTAYFARCLVEHQRRVGAGCDEFDVFAVAGLVQHVEVEQARPHALFVGDAARPLGGSVVDEQAVGRVGQQALGEVVDFAVADHVVEHVIGGGRRHRAVGQCEGNFDRDVLPIKLLDEVLRKDVGVVTHKIFTQKKVDAKQQRSVVGHDGIANHLGDNGGYAWFFFFGKIMLVVPKQISKLLRNRLQISKLCLASVVQAAHLGGPQKPAEIHRIGYFGVIGVGHHVLHKIRKYDRVAASQAGHAFAYA